MSKLKRTYRRIGTMLDCSRNAVMKVETVKKWIDLCADLDFNMLMLYTEDTYEVKENPYFGYCRGRYSKKELKEINDYAAKQGMELIPCIQTLAHLNAITRWPAYRDHIDLNDILLAGDETVYELIENMFATISQCFDSHYVNVGMDEAHMIGRGRYYDMNGDTDRSRILIDHVKRIAEIGKRYGLTLCMWSDMLFRLAAGDYYKGDAKINEEIRRQIPDNVELIYWDYYSDDALHYDRMMKAHDKIKPGAWFAGGLWTWTGFAPHNAYTMKASRAALKACADNHVQDLFFTLWGDNGAECSKFSVLPSLFYVSELAKGNWEKEDIKRKFQEKYGISWDDFMLLDLTDSPNGKECGYIINSEKYLLYNDPFLGLMDSTLRGDEEEHFLSCAKKLAQVPKDRAFGYLFETQEALCRVLALKAGIGQRTRKAYERGDKEALTAVMDEYQVLEERLSIFYEAFRRQWYLENKGHGFDVQDIRLGGLMQRVRHCREMLLDYLAGRTDHIDELEEKLLDFDGNGGSFSNEPKFFNCWSENATANVL